MLFHLIYIYSVNKRILGIYSLTQKLIFYNYLFNNFNNSHMNRDLLNPSYEHQKNTHKLKRLVPTSNSYFMDVKCSGCSETTVVFSHAQSVIACNNCKNVLTKPTGGKCLITEGSAFQVKHWSCIPHNNRMLMKN